MSASSLCDRCNGACCRYVTIDVDEMTPDQRRWATMRGDLDGARWRIRCECENLTTHGTCAVYPHRPDVCKEFRAGSMACMKAREAAEDDGHDN
jgi:hypothetical protein